MAKVIVDFTGVESYSRAEEGRHLAELVELNEKDSNGGNPMLVGVFEVVKGSSKGCRVFENFPLSQNALWKLKQMLEAIGVQNTTGKLRIDTDKMLKRRCLIDVYHEEYNNQLRAKINAFANPAAAAKPKDEDDDAADADDGDDAGDDAEEETPPPKKAAPKPADKKPAPKPAPAAKGKAKPAPKPADDEDEDGDWEEA